MAEIDRHLERLKARGFNWPIPWPVVEQMGRKEGCFLVSYLCPSKVWTLGWGETDGVEPNMRWTEDQVDARFFQQVVIYTKRVDAMLSLAPNENQLGAMVSLAYNIGLRRDKPTKGGFYHSSIRRLHNAGDFAGAARSFALYNKGRDSAGKLVEFPGLVTRRAWEAALYLTPSADAPDERTPQAVAPESSLAQSPIARGGAATVVGGAATLANTVADEITQTTGMLGVVKTSLAAVKGVVHQLADITGVSPGAMLALALIVAGIAVVRYRDRQRREGWA